MSREWLTLLIRRMDAVAAAYRLAASMSPDIDGLRSHVEFHRRWRFDATITLHDGQSFGVVRQGLALRRRSLYDRLRAIAGYDYTRRPSAVLILTPSVWEERLTTRFCERLNLDDCYVAVEIRDALERRDLRVWQQTTGLFGSSYHTLEAVSSHGSPGGRRSTASPERKRASLPRPERMTKAAPAFGVSPAEKRTLDLVTDHPMIPREHLAIWLGVSEGRVSQMMRSLVNAWGLVEQRGKRGDVRYTLSAEGIRYVTHRDRAQLPTTQGIWSTALTTDKQEAMRDRAPKVQRPARVGSKFLLSGLLKCGVCGRPYRAQGAKSGQFAYYICGTLFTEGAGTCSARYLNAPRLEAFVVEKIRERILTEETIVALVTMVAEEIDAMAGELSGRLEVIEAELGDVRKRLEKLYEAIETSELTLEVLSPRILSLRHREEQLEAARDDAERQLEQRSVELPTTEEIKEYVADFRDFLEEGTIPECKALIRNFVEGIEVNGDEAVPTYTIPMPNDGVTTESASVPLGAIVRRLVTLEGVPGINAGSSEDMVVIVTTGQHRHEVILEARRERPSRSLCARSNWVE